MNFIILTQKIIDEHKKDMFYYLSFCRYNLTTQLINLTRTEHSSKSWFNRAAPSLAWLQRKIGVTYTTWRQWRDTYPSFVYTDDVMVCMPFEVFDELEEILATLPLKSRNAYAYAYAYLYFRIPYQYDMYERSVEQLSEDWHTNRNQVNARLHFFIENQLLERLGSYKFTGERTFSYQYTIPTRLRSKVFKN